jgi:hypothetical protein
MYAAANFGARKGITGTAEDCLSIVQGLEIARYYRGITQVIVITWVIPIGRVMMAGRASPEA